MSELDDDAALEAAMQAEDEEHGKSNTPEPEDSNVDVEPQADEPTESEVAEKEEPEPEPAKPLGIASKDGKAVLPYAALKGARAETKRERELRTQAEAERDALKQQIEALKSGKSEEPDPLDELVDDFPAMKTVVEEVRLLREQVKTRAPVEKIEPQDDPAEAVQEAIDSVPSLAEWQASDPEKWARAVAIDAALKDSPKWKSKPMEERFRQVAKSVADEFDIQTDQPSPVAPGKARHDPEEVVKAATRTAPNTLSDFKGGAASSHSQNVERMPAAQRRAAVAAMTDEQIEDWLAKQG